MPPVSDLPTVIFLKTQPDLESEWTLSFGNDALNLIPVDGQKNWRHDDDGFTNDVSLFWHGVLGDEAIFAGVRHRMITERRPGMRRIDELSFVFAPSFERRNGNSFTRLGMGADWVFAGNFGGGALQNAVHSLGGGRTYGDRLQDEYPERGEFGMRLTGGWSFGLGTPNVELEAGGRGGFGMGAAVSQGEIFLRGGAKAKLRSFRLSANAELGLERFGSEFEPLTMPGGYNTNHAHFIERVGLAVGYGRYALGFRLNVGEGGNKENVGTIDFSWRR